MRVIFLFFLSAMESGFVTYILILTVVFPSLTYDRGWDDVVVIRENTLTTLNCTDTPVRGPVTINWKYKRHVATNEWSLVYSSLADAYKQFPRMKDRNILISRDFSLEFQPMAEDSGLYSCLIEYQIRKQREKIILLAVLRVTIAPPPPVPLGSALRLIAQISPDFARVKITWVSPRSHAMRSEDFSQTQTVAKLPVVEWNDEGSYVCTVEAWAKSRITLFAFNVGVRVNVGKRFSFTNIRNDNVTSIATQNQTSVNLKCPSIRGDLVKLYWVPYNSRIKDEKNVVFQYERWKNPYYHKEESLQLQLAGPPYNPEAGSFSFQLRPNLRDGGLYVCEVFLDDYSYSQSTLLSVLAVKIHKNPSSLELGCTYTELSHVQSAVWIQNDSHKLSMFSHFPGSIRTIVPFPITHNKTGNYSCALRLKNGEVVQEYVTVTLPSKESNGVTTPPVLPSLSALLLLVPLVAAAVGVLLWRQKHISVSGIEQSLSVHLSETENIYENPDVREAPPEGSVYMDLKPRGVDDVYKELEL